MADMGSDRIACRRVRERKNYRKAVTGETVGSAQGGEAPFIKQALRGGGKHFVKFFTSALKTQGLQNDTWLQKRRTLDRNNSY